MSKRNSANLLKSTFKSFWGKIFSSGRKGDEWAKRQIKEFSKLGGTLVVMKMES